MYLVTKRWRTWLSPAARKGRDRAREQALARERGELVQHVAELSQEYAAKKHAGKN